MDAPKKSINKLLLTVVVVSVIVFMSTTVFAAFGGFDQFLRRAAPPFGDIILPVMEYAEDQGIRVTMLGARRFDNAAVLYLSMHDVMGENRVTEMACVARSLDISENIQSSRHSAIHSSWGMSVAPIYFDEISNTKYFQIILDSSRPLSDELSVVLSSIVLEQEFCDNWHIISDVSLTGEWRVAAYLENAQDEYIHLENLVLENTGVRFELEQIVINPIVMQINGRIFYDMEELQGLYIESDEWFNPMNSKPMHEYNRFIFGLYIEAAGETIRAPGGGSVVGGFGYKSFTASFQFNALLELNEVTAIIMNGERIEIP